MKFRSSSIAVLVALFISVLAVDAQTPTPVSVVLFNTGVDDSGVPLASLSQDPHWTVIAPDGSTTGPFVNNFSGWLATPPDANWISPFTDGFASGPMGDYVYSTTFKVNAADVSNVEIAGNVAADNTAVVLLNGSADGITLSGEPGYGYFTNFSIGPGAHFQAGANVLSVRVTNDPGSGPNPTGVMVEFTSGAVVTLPPTPPPHGGLSATVFTVNGSDSPAANVADTVLRFAAQQTGTPAGLFVRVQATTTPGTESSWTDLPNESRGYMALDTAKSQFVLNATNYPLQNGIYFRALSSAPGYSDSISNSVGPFDLSSAGAHIPPVVLLVKRNGSLADLAFTAGEISAPSGVALRVQSSTTPATESSWTDLADGNSGRMTRSTNSNYPNVFLLLANKLPAGSGIYFRAVASLSGSIDSRSNITGPYTLTADTPPVVTLHPPAGVGGSGTQSDPLIVPTGTFHFSADATPDLGRSASKITSLKLQIDGSTLSDTPSAPAGIDYTTSAIGDHGSGSGGRSWSQGEGQYRRDLYSRRSCTEHSQG
jgi:hypothetical protein